ncbi:hypothetical protein [Hydrogenimonas sp.]
MHILQDENLRSRPIASALDYTWAALSGNWKNSAIIASVLLVLTIAQVIPFIGVVAAVLSSVILYSVVYWIVDALMKSGSAAGLKEKVETVSAKEMLFSFLAPASGFYLGFILVSLLVIAATALIFWLTGGGTVFGMIQEQMAQPNATPQRSMEFYAQIVATSTPTLIFFFIVSSFFGYLWPLIYGYALLQRNFSDAMNAVFMLFSPRFWSASFTWKYLKTVSLWMLLAIGASILIAICGALVLLIPVAVLLMIWLAYFTAIVSVETYNFCDDI